MILRLCVVIPTFNNLRTINEVVKDIVMTTPFSVLVIDDGSETPVANVLYSWEVRKALEQNRVRVLRFEQNRGKGAALQFAIVDLVSRGFTHMLTMDGDGQHFAREIHKLVDLAKQNPWDIIIGDRRLKSEAVPKISKFGRAFSNFWVKFETGLQVKDSQSGFRLYPLFAMQTMRFFTRRYDFEIEVLIRLMWNGIGVREIEIDVYYPKNQAERLSHFNKLWDNVRISTLNTLLVAVSLFKTHRSPGEMATALGMGVFLGCSPFFGFHTLSVVIVALLLRLNVIFMWLGMHVSLPIFAPFLILTEIWIGRHWLHIPSTSGVQGDFYQWMAGSLVLGVLLGLATAAVAYAVAWYCNNRKQRTNWSGRTRGGRLGNGILKLILRHGGRQFGYAVLFFVVPYFYLFAPKALRGLNEYWQLVGPHDTWWARQVRVLRHYFKFGQVLMDRVYQSYHLEKKFSLRPDGLENILARVQNRQGLIMLTAHLGGWDLAATKGLSDDIFILEYQAKGLSFQKVKDKLGADHVHTLNSSSSGSDAIFTIHEALQKGRCLALMGDRPLGDRFELVPFMGKLAPFDVTAFRVAAALHVPLLFTFGFKGSGNSYDFFARPAKIYQYNSEGDEARELQTYNWLKEYVAEIEYFVRRYPDQWFNFYPFWSALPVAPNGTLGAQANNKLLEDLNRPLVLKPEWAPGSRPTGAV